MSDYSLISINKENDSYEYRIDRAWRKEKINAEFLYRLSWNTQQTQFVCNGNYRSTDRERNNQIDLFIFFRDPLTPRSHEPSVSDIVKMCDMYNIPAATNIATAEALILALDRGDLDWREMYK